MEQIYVIPDSIIFLGHAGENLAREIIFDVSAWHEQYGDGYAVLIAQRVGEDTPYPCDITADGDTVRWPITSADNAIPGGYGRCELQYRINETVVKSSVWRTLVEASLSDQSEEPPEPQQSWVDKVLEAGQLVENAQDVVDGLQGQVGQLQVNVGDLEGLKTSSKSSLVAAINEAYTVSGEKGEDGVSPTVTTAAIDGGTRITITDVTGDKVVDVLNGKDGDPGENGNTPVKGVDYWTESDVNEIVQNVLTALPDGDEVNY